MARIRRIVGSFAAVVIVYWAYALLAVPWIEPAANLRDRGAITPRSGRGPANWPTGN